MLGAPSLVSRAPPPASYATLAFRVAPAPTPLHVFSASQRGGRPPSRRKALDALMF